MNRVAIERRTIGRKAAQMLALLLACSWLTSAVHAADPAASADTASAAPAETKTLPLVASPRIVAVHAGLAGKFKVGYWTPFVVDLEGGSQPAEGYVQIVTPDSEGVPTRVHAPADKNLSLAAGEKKSVVLYTKLGQLAADVTVSLHDRSGVLASRRFRAGGEGPLAGVMPSGSTLVVSIGDSATQEKRPVGAKGGLPLTRVANITELPPEWWGLEGVDAVILHASDVRLGEQFAQAQQQLAALDLWVRMGGRLVLSVGEQAPALLAPDKPLARFAPGTFDALVPLRQSTVFETYSESSEPLSPGEVINLNIPRLRDVRGRVEAFAGTGPRDLPVVVRTPHGFGEVVFAAFDLDRAPIANWAAHPQLVQKLLGGTLLPAAESESGVLGQVTTLGFSDLSGQLRGALDQFPGVRLVPFWLVVTLCSLYLLCIGPLDYYVVKVLFRRPIATWFTFSLTVLLFAAGAAALAFNLKGTERRVNQLDIVDFDGESGLVRGTSWSNLFSPRVDTYNLTLRPGGVAASNNSSAPNSPASGMLFSWFGLAGNAFGGLDAGRAATGGFGTASTALPLFTEPYDFSARLDGIEHFPIAVWSSRALVGRWWQTAAGAGEGSTKQHSVEANLADDGRLVGTIANRLEVPLTDAVLLYDKWAYVIREFAPGREVDLEFDIDPQTIDTYLKHVTAVGDHKIVRPYDQAAFDVPTIVELMTAHELAGGKTYTGLANQYQRFVELSGLVRGGRAVLIGRVAKPAATLERDGQPLADSAASATSTSHTQSWTYYRYVFPVAEKRKP
jgi:hypothetical protein